MPLTTLRPRLDVPLEDHGAAIFSSLQSQWYRFTAFLFLSYLSYQFIKKFSYSVALTLFRCMAALYTKVQINVKQMFVFLRKNLKIF